MLNNFDQKILFDFPNKDTIYIQNENKAESCFLKEIDSQFLYSPKDFISWKKITKSKQSPFKEMSFNDNYLFKGNNLVVLHTILPIFQKSVKLIYIDPPYNTGNSFVYKDKLSRYTWLIFMKNRIDLAKQFLQDDGVLFIQCDENEQAYLKVLCDEIFSEECFLGSIAVQMNPGGRDYRSLARTHEYLLVYGKTPQAELYPLILDKEFPFNDKLGGFELRNLRNGNIRFHQGNRPNLYYPFYVNPNKIDEFGLHPISIKKKRGYIPVFPRLSQGVQTVWRWGKEKSENNLSLDTHKSNLVARKSKDGYLIFEKYRKNTRLARTLWLEKEFQTTKGTKHIKQIFGESVFDYPKPELLIARIIDISTQKGDRIMDFFLGSGTTCSVAHKSGRTWIGVEQMEYIDTVTIPRLQQTLAGEKGGATEHYQWLGGGSFLYATLAGDPPYYNDYSKDTSHLITEKFYNLHN